MGNKNLVRQKLCLLNLHSKNNVVTWNLKIMKYSPSAMITPSFYFEISATLFQPLELKFFKLATVGGVC